MSLAPARLAALAPVIFVLHVVEEAPAFVVWVNELIEPDITQSLFLAVNAAGFVITALLAALMWTRSREVALLTLTWFSFLMLANAVLHIGGTLMLGRYAPGVITATLLYLPYYFLFLRSARREHSFSPLVLGLAMSVGSAPMLLHGYLILFRGSRLF